MQIHNPQYKPLASPRSTQSIQLDTLGTTSYPVSCCRDDPIHSPALQLLAEACDMPQRFPPTKEDAPPPLASCSYVLGYSKSPLARLAAMPFKPTPKYHSRRPEVAQFLVESAISPDEATPLSSDYPSWVIAVAALSLFHHPSYPAHLAFWRPEIMNSMAEFIDAFLSSCSLFSYSVFIRPNLDPTETREAKYLETLEGWIDAEFSLYTLKGHQRGYYPHLYDPVTGGRILRKRKVKEMEPGSPQAAEESKPKRRTKRIRKTKGSDPPESVIDPNASHSVDSTLSPSVDMDVDEPTNVPPTNHAPSPDSHSTSPDLSSAPLRATKHRRRSSSVTSSGASGVTLVESEGAGAEGSRENSPAETAVDSEEVPDAKPFEQVKDFTEKLDDNTPSVRSSLSPLESTPPPPPRRSARATKKTTTQVVKRPVTTYRARSKRAAA